MITEVNIVHQVIMFLLLLDEVIVLSLPEKTLLIVFRFYTIWLFFPAWH